MKVVISWLQTIDYDFFVGRKDSRGSVKKIFYMKRTITYKDFTLTYVYNRNNKRYEGSVNDFDDGISFVGRTKEEIKESFEEAVDGYYRMMEIVDREMSGYKGMSNPSDRLPKGRSSRTNAFNFLY